MAVFGLLKRGGKVYTAMLSNVKTETLLPLIERKGTPDSVVYSDTFGASNALNVSDFHHLRINHSKRFSEQRNQRKFSEPGQASFAVFYGIKSENFYGLLKECEWRCRS